MLIVLGGLKGSGRRSLAQELARQRGFHWYDTKRHRMRGHFFKKDGTIEEYLTQVSGDVGHLFLLGKVVGDLPLLSKMYPDAVLDYPFNRRASREYFLDEAQHHFAQVLFVWVHSAEERAHERLLVVSGMESNQRFQSAIRGRQRATFEYEPIEDRLPTLFERGKG